MIIKRSSIRAFALLFLATIGWTCGGSNDLRLGHNDVIALNRIYDFNGRSFRYSYVNVQVRGEGVIEIDLRGDATLKQEDDDLWLPIILLRDLPTYFRRVDIDQPRFDLDAYQATGGLWCITAAVLREDLVSSADASRAIPFHLRVLLYSRTFEHSIPFAIPKGPGSGGLDLSVQLPLGGKFETAEVRTANASLDVRRLSVLPEMVTNGAVTAAANLHPQKEDAWDLSHVTFSVPGTFGLSRPWLIPLALLMLVLSLGACVNWYGLLWTENDISALGRAIAQSAGAAATTLHEVFRNLSDDWWESKKALSEKEAWLSELFMLKAAEPTSPRSIKALVSDSLFSNLDETLTALGRRPPAVRPELVERARIQVRALETAIFALKRASDAKKNRSMAIALLIIAAAVLIVWLLVTVAPAQILGTAAPKVTGPATLFDMVMRATPEDPASQAYETVNVALTFFPFTSIKSSGASEFQIGTGNSTTVSIEPMTNAADGNMTVLQQTGKRSRLAIRAPYARISKRLRYLGTLPVGPYQPPAEYFTLLESGNLLTLSYRLHGAQRLHQRANAWLYWFPWDTIDIEVPIDFGAPVLLSRLEVIPPAGGYVGLPRAEGLDLFFRPLDDGNRYQATASSVDARIALLPGKPIMLRAEFTRPPLQQHGLTWGILLMAVVLGGLAGAATKATRTFLVLLSEAAAGLGLLVVVRNAVFDTYKTLPKIAVFQAVTVFEIIFIIAVLIFVVSSYVTRKVLS